VWNPACESILLDNSDKPESEKGNIKMATTMVTSFTVPPDFTHESLQMLSSLESFDLEELFRAYSIRLLLR